MKEYLDELLTADGFDEAIIGYTCTSVAMENEVVVYDYMKCIDILMERDGMEYEDADEFLQFNTLGSYVGPLTPIFIMVTGPR
tara:strand:+ start:19093 stop:19341 length:249 start_codon:yes stop_codon:yes gene_type:complete